MRGVECIRLAIHKRMPFTLGTGRRKRTVIGYKYLLHTLILSLRLYFNTPCEASRAWQVVELGQIMSSATTGHVLYACPLRNPMMLRVPLSYTMSSTLAEACKIPTTVILATFFRLYLWSTFLTPGRAFAPRQGSKASPHSCVDLQVRGFDEAVLMLTKL